MKVRELITILLNEDMDFEIVIAVEESSANRYGTVSIDGIAPCYVNHGDYVILVPRENLSADN